MWLGLKLLEPDASGIFSLNIPCDLAGSRRNSFLMTFCNYCYVLHLRSSVNDTLLATSGGVKDPSGVKAASNEESKNFLLTRLPKFRQTRIDTSFHCRLIEPSSLDADEALVIRQALVPSSCSSQWPKLQLIGLYKYESLGDNVCCITTSTDRQ